MFGQAMRINFEKTKFEQTMIYRSNNLKLSLKSWFEGKIPLMQRLTNMLFYTKITLM